jgi:N-acetylglutamate synthase-like GNAT family acetyltransferase
MPTTARSSEVEIRPLRREDVDAADEVMRTAFGTFLGAPDPAQVFGDAQHVRPRFAAGPGWAFAAELDGEIVGSNIATRWGSFSFFGPLTVRPDLWGGGIASRLMEPVMDLFEQWRVRQAGLFTFSHSTKHVALYQKFGFWPQHLTALMERPLAPGAGEADPPTFSLASEGEREALVGRCRELTDAIFEGLDLEHEIRMADEQSLGDTVIVDGDAGLEGFAVCHLGAGEAGSGTCYVKFGAVRPGPRAGERFEQLLGACEAHARRRGLERVFAGVNLARHDAYRRLLASGYAARMLGVVMQRPNEPGYCRADVYAIDDLR